MIKIVLEGMPGAGKTSYLTKIIRLFDYNTILLPELNPVGKYIINNSNNSWQLYHKLWQKRIKIINDKARHLNILYDRSYFTTLAFTYAMNDKTGYLEQKDAINRDFFYKDFDIIIVLDVLPEIGLQRRIKNCDVPIYPWNNLEFLARLREFYHEQLPNLYFGKLIFLDTSFLSLEETYLSLINTINLYFHNLIFNNSIPDETDKDTSKINLSLINYAKNKNLGSPYTSIINVLGYPTVYFRQYAVQFDNNIALFLDNERLSYILSFTK